MIDVKKLATDLALRGKAAENGMAFDVMPIPGEIEVLRIDAGNRARLVADRAGGKTGGNE